MPPPDPHREPAEPLDLLIAGGLTIDRVRGGPDAPGGSVLHAARVAARAGLRVAVVTSAGSEPPARAGIEELRAICAEMWVAPAAETTTFRHAESPTGRRLWLERPGAPISLPDAIGSPAAALLLAPVAGEIDPANIARASGWPTRAAILQGWLRDVAADGSVAPREFADLPAADRAALRQFDLLVASREDLPAGTRAAAELAAELGGWFDGPTVVLTDADDGLWIAPGSRFADRAPFHLAVPRRVDGVASVGAGDILAASLVAGGWPAERSLQFLERRARDAMELVARELERRRAST